MFTMPRTKYVNFNRPGLAGNVLQIPFLLISLLGSQSPFSSKFSKPLHFKTEILRKCLFNCHA